MAIDPNSPAFPAEAARLLKIADSIDISTVVSRYAREQKVTLPRARAVGVEGKRFLVLCAMNAQPYAVGGEVDSFWHTFVLFTVRYAKFCQAVAGHFIHHIPGDDMTDDAATARARYAATLRDYQLAFGQAPDPSIWPRSVAAGNDSDAGPCVHDCTPALDAAIPCVHDCTPAVGEAAGS
ncbi:MAG TPA: hypothetical protein PLJ16_06775 [Casimicrobium huifangae]|jgi:hypothetical protein|uniref:glycine-rich domain-containing protein n=1 Tax=Casimicrobium huifangae TaxID=2591109 RepID=UPI002B8CBF9B|nr:hypothetical protein [Casimicrobium huifangae]HQD64911.1 hypothetical protein [Casimicrobium huifangae]